MREKLHKIIISVEDLSVQAELNDTNTAEKIFKALPIEGTVNLWGDEIYFDIPLELDLENDARADVEVGELGYWPSGPAFCIFFGPTPVSRDEKPRAYSPVNIFGRIIGDTTRLKTVSNGSKIRITKPE
ncbi:MAG: hypothetical protein KJ550_08345 [Proteobacteria bacterium]|nr:hypothetical protein [Desulfobacteraceae bacterium]MBU3981040.1 hypothetical protein [Pseudomonadota bacterium]MBU4013462.1 hypothetical protein [Pseudomonadota bacterium]MBU4066688.1 hypothetical protein [Pseudomonadota bacterium]MBU4100722.1 hypothetical protein [Pseudomonadota bacterium]